MMEVLDRDGSDDRDDCRPVASSGALGLRHPKPYRMLIGGEWVDARSGETFESVDPFTGRPWATFPRARRRGRRRGGARGARRVRRRAVAGDDRQSSARG